MKNEAFKKGMGALILAFPSKVFNNDFMWDYLQDLTDEEFLNGVQKFISSGKDLYPGSNIIAIIRENAKVKKHLLAGEAWGLVRAAIGSLGSYGYPKFDDPLIDRAVLAVGWKDMCLSENPSVERAHFLKIYESLCERDSEEQVYLPVSSVKKLLEKKE